MVNNTALRGSSPSVLIVDDDEFGLHYLQEILGAIGITDIHTASDGRKAVHASNQMVQPPDFLISDIFMPTMDGIELVSELAKRSYPGGIILISGGDASLLAIAKTVASKNELNVLATLTKPIKKTELRQALGLPIKLNQIEP